MISQRCLRTRKKVVSRSKVFIIHATKYITVVVVTILYWRIMYKPSFGVERSIVIVVINASKFDLVAGFTAVYQVTQQNGLLRPRQTPRRHFARGFLEKGRYYHLVHSIGAMIQDLKATEQSAPTITNSRFLLSLSAL